MLWESIDGAVSRLFAMSTSTTVDKRSSPGRSITERGAGVGKKLAVNAMHLAARCGARTRKGTTCCGPAMANGRCRMHGGNNPGAPVGNRNAWKHGLRSGEHQAMSKALRELVAALGKRNTA